MNTLHRVKSVQEFHEEDKDQGVERTYLYYKNQSIHIHTEKQEVDILESAAWGKMLFLDGTLQSTTQDEVIYHNALVHPLMSVVGKRGSILILGGGEGATAREVLRWQGVENVIMVDYDKELVDVMRGPTGDRWSKGSFRDRRLQVLHDDAWHYMPRAGNYDAVIVDLTDPDLKKQKWMPLLQGVMDSIKPTMGGFVMNAGLYLPWKTEQLRYIKDMIEELCLVNPGFRYYIYTTLIPSFNGEWTFIVVSHKKQIMTEPEYLPMIPGWIRRGIRTLENKYIDTAASTDPVMGMITPV
jgi:spermidine synthase